MLGKIKKFAASVAMAASLAVGGSLIAAPASQAVTYGSPQKWQTGGTYCPVMMYADYNWWEEVFLGKRDGWQLQYYAYC